MATEPLSKVIGIRIPQPIMAAYEEEAEATAIPVAVLVRRDVVRFHASGNATSRSENATDNGPSSGQRQQPGAEDVKAEGLDTDRQDSALSAEERGAA